jgi:hypothetical protein
MVKKISNKTMEKQTKKWWAVTMATHLNRRTDANVASNETFIIFADFDAIIQSSLTILQEKFHEFICPKFYYEMNGQEEKCNCKNFFIDCNKQAKINFYEIKIGAEISIYYEGAKTKLIFNCLESNGKFNLEEAKRMASIVSTDIKNLVS